jgi:serine/threonine protein kinase
LLNDVWGYESYPSTRTVDKVTGLLGAGGMGGVYQAKDPKLKRDVAIKVLPDALASNSDRLARFQREAEVLAALNHPNIAHVYGFEESGASRCIIMELVPSDTLADRLRRSPFSMDEAIHVAKQIAEGLEAAHEKGIIHRDLKPANIKLTPDGRVKVLDFGLAKIFSDHAAGLSLSNSPTLMSGGSAPGVIMGTAEYMSPEQARGGPLDRRTDIWSFGCVLYELLAGRRTFASATISDAIAAILTREPDWTALPPETPRTFAGC